MVWAACLLKVDQILVALIDRTWWRVRSYGPRDTGKMFGQILGSTPSFDQLYNMTHLFEFGRADVDERQKLNLVSPFDIQEIPCGEWQETQVESQAELLSVDCYAPYARPPHSKLIFRGEVGFELRWHTTWSCQGGGRNRDGAVSFESACLGSQAKVFIVFRVGAIAESRGTIGKYWLRTPRSSWDFLRMYSSVDVEKA